MASEKSTKIYKPCQNALPQTNGTQSLWKKHLHNAFIRWVKFQYDISLANRF